MGWWTASRALWRRPIGPTAFFGPVGHADQQPSGSRTAPCSLVVERGVVPRLLPDHNLRVPDLAVTCAPYQTEEAVLTDPVLLIEILSPSNQAKTWTNVWAYTSIPSVLEILILRADRIAADLLRRSPQGEWPERPVAITEGEVVLESIGFRMSLTDLYRGTRFAG
jgi:Uma2 family endonuclease